MNKLAGEKHKPLLTKLSQKKSSFYPKSLVDDQGNLKTTKLGSPTNLASGFTSSVGNLRNDFNKELSIREKTVSSV